MATSTIPLVRPILNALTRPLVLAQTRTAQTRPHAKLRGRANATARGLPQEVVASTVAATKAPARLLGMGTAEVRGFQAELAWTVVVPQTKRLAPLSQMDTAVLLGAHKAIAIIIPAPTMILALDGMDIVLQRGTFKVHAEEMTGAETIQTLTIALWTLKATGLAGGRTLRIARIQDAVIQTLVRGKVLGAIVRGMTRVIATIAPARRKSPVKALGTGAEVRGTTQVTAKIQPVKATNRLARQGLLSVEVRGRTPRIVMILGAVLITERALERLRLAEALGLQLVGLVPGRLPVRDS